jgi:excisionase family DNA binding protein
VTITSAVPVLTAQEVADLWRVRKFTVTRWAKAGKIPAVKTPGGDWRFPRAEILALRNGGTS